MAAGGGKLKFIELWKYCSHSKCPTMSHVWDKWGTLDSLQPTCSFMGSVRSTELKHFTWLLLVLKMSLALSAGDTYPLKVYENPYSFLFLLKDRIVFLDVRQPMIKIKSYAVDENMPMLRDFTTPRNDGCKARIIFWGQTWIWNLGFLFLDECFNHQCP